MVNLDYTYKNIPHRLKVEFEYRGYNTEIINKKGDVQEMFVPVDTYCRLFNDNGDQVAFGIAACHPNDQFSRITGRKLALRDAFAAAEIGYDERKEIWNAYKKVIHYKGGE